MGLKSHHSRAHATGVALPGAYVLAPGSALCILRVWIGCTNQATPRWQQILQHIKKLISQWMAIRASVLNRALLAKLLMMSHCYYLLDGNGIPPCHLSKISNMIDCFVRGHYSTLPYWLMAPPLLKGGLNLPSLSLRKKAYNLKFLGDLIHGDQTILWKVWTQADLHRASTARQSTMTSRNRPHNRDKHINLDPLLQRSFIKCSALEPCVKHAIMVARSS